MNLKFIELAANDFKCNMDEIIDTICLAFSANFIFQGGYTMIPKTPMLDETGLIMQMVVPKI